MTATTDAIPCKLASKATEAVARARNEAPAEEPGTTLIRAAGIIRREWQDTDGHKPALRDVRDAVQACMNRQTTMDTIAPYSRQSGSGWIYRFPNGRWASVVAEAQPLRFEVTSADGERATGLTTNQVEALLIDIATRAR